MKLKNVKQIFLVIILSFFVVFLYFYKLDQIPSGVYVDEAVSGYNSFSVLKTEKDEYGKVLPLALRYFVSYTPPLYAYASVIPISVLGLNELSTRFIGAISGVLSVLVAYLFIKHLNILSGYNRIFGVALFAISPWVVFYSRVGYEVHFAFLIFAAGAYFCLKSLTNIRYLPFAFTLLAISSYASHTQKYLLIIWIPAFFLVFGSHLNIRKNFKLILVSLAITSLLLMPYLSLLNTQALLSKNSLFYTHAIIDRANNSVLPIFLGFPVAAAYEFFARYLTYFSPKSLFFLGDPDLQRSLPELSVFYVWMVFPYLIGLYKVLTNLKAKSYAFLLFLLLISPIPAALTFDPFSTQRALPVFFPITLIILIGVSSILNMKIRLLTILLLFFSLVYSPLMLWRSYFVLFPVERAQAWGYGYKELVKQIDKYKDTSFVIDQSRLKPVYIQYAFFRQYDPYKMQSHYSSSFVKNYYNETQFNPPSKLDNVEFRPLIWEEDICKSQILVGDHLTFSENNIKEHFLSLEFKITDPKNEVLFVGYKTNPELKCNGHQSK